MLHLVMTSGQSQPRDAYFFGRCDEKGVTDVIDQANR